MALVDDARQVSAEQGLDFRVFTYHQATLQGKTAEIAGAREAIAPQSSATCEPDDDRQRDRRLGRRNTRAAARCRSSRLMGGTKGSHFFTFNSRLRKLLGSDGIYAEAGDGRPIFITPLADCVLIGTTDERFDGSARGGHGDRSRARLSARARSTRSCPDARLRASDIDFHYSAVRPLAPYGERHDRRRITRRHALVGQRAAPPCR